MENFSAIVLSLENLIKYVNKIKSEKISEFGIKAAHFNCLMRIDLSPDGLTSTELSKDSGVDRAFISRTTTDLIKGGFIKTNDKFDDGRKYKVKYILTEKGKEVIRETKQLFEKYLLLFGTKISEIDLNGFFKVLLAFNETADSISLEN